MNHCPNCKSELVENAQFCFSCGQKQGELKVTAWVLFKEFLANVFNLDNKFFRSFITLCFPGRLTKVYFEGKRQHYITPGRLFFLSAFFLLAAISFSEKDGESFNIVRGLGEETVKAKANAKIADSIRVQLDSFATHQPDLDGAALDSVRQLLKQYEVPTDTLPPVFFFKETRNKHWEPAKVTTRDMVMMPVDSLYEKYQITHWFQKYKLRQSKRIMEEGEAFNQYIFGKILWGIFFMIPALSLALKLLYIRRSRYFSEHIVFSMHVLSMTLLLPIAAILAENKNLMLGTLAVITVYALLAMKFYYGQSWMKTLFKFLLVGIAYLIFMLLSFILVLIFSAFFY